MPDEVQSPGGEAHVHEQQHEAEADFPAQSDAGPRRRHEEQRQHKDCDRTAGYVGHAVSDIRVGAHEEAAEEVKEVTRGVEVDRECVARGGRVLQDKVSRDRDHGRKRACDERTQRKSSRGSEEGADAEPVGRHESEVNNYREERQEDAKHVSRVVVGDDGCGKGCDIKAVLSFLEEPYEAEGNERQQYVAVTPHDVPEV